MPKPVFSYDYSLDLYVVEDLVTLTASLDDKEIEITIDKGFKFDGASIPRVLWSLLGYHEMGRMSTPALAHDFLYQTTDHNYSRKDADKIFYHLMRKKRIGIKRHLFYWVVRLVGTPRWDFYREMI